MQAATAISHELSYLVATFDSHLKNWLSKGAPRTPNRLAVLTKIRRQSIYDLCQGKTSILNWNSTKVIRILSIVENLSEQEIFKKYSKELSALDKQNNDAPLKVDNELSFNEAFTRTFTEAMKNPIAFKIYALSLSPKGVSEGEIVKEFGQYGLSIASDLTEKNIIVYSQNKSYFPINHQTLNLTRSQVKALIPTLNSFYTEEHSNLFRNYISIRLDSINRDALLKIHDAYSRLDREIAEILASPDSKGEIPFYCFYN